jgi:membrane-bound lytic murein transglycosylase A
LIILISLAACARPPEPPVAPVVPPPDVEKPEPVTPEAPLLEEVSWSEVGGWQDDNPGLALGSFLKGCRALRWRPQWQDVCQAAKELEGSTEADVRRFFEQDFTPHRLQKPDGTTRGLVTGYYVPDLRGSRQATPDYAYPLYGRPDDLLTIDMGDLYPELGKYRLRGRLDGHRVIPYWGRSEIDGHEQPLSGQELFWVTDPVELFFLHIQGSGQIVLEDGSRVMVNYADQNGHPYRSIGKWLIDHGEMTRDQMSMQNIRAWARKNPQSVESLLGENPSYVFFRELDSSFDSPPGALGVPLTPGRSLAVDPRYIPLGTPVFLSTSWPNSSKPLNRLMVAQDTGGAIKGPVRGDFFWGMGDQAGSQAGRMKQSAWMWVLLPKSAEESP